MFPRTHSLPSCSAPASSSTRTTSTWLFVTERRSGVSFVCFYVCSGVNVIIRLWQFCRRDVAYKYAYHFKTTNVKCGCNFACPKSSITHTNHAMHRTPWLVGSDSLWVSSRNISQHWRGLYQRQRTEESPHTWWHTIWQTAKHTQHVRKMVTQNREDSSYIHTHTSKPHARSPNYDTNACASSDDSKQTHVTTTCVFYYMYTQNLICLTRVRFCFLHQIFQNIDVAFFRGNEQRSLPKLNDIQFDKQWNTHTSR